MNNNNNTNPPTAARNASPSSSTTDTAALMAASLQSLEQLQIDPNSSFSSDKLCRQFLVTSRMAGSLQDVTDDVVEIVLEQVSPYWTNSDIFPLIRDALETAEELKRQCEDELQPTAASFCGAAERVIKGATDEVRAMSEEIAQVQDVNERLVVKIEDAKSKIATMSQRAENLRSANAARRLCLLAENGSDFWKVFSDSMRQALLDEAGAQGKKILQRGASVGRDGEADGVLAASSLSSQRKSFHAEDSSTISQQQLQQSFKSRLRMLLSAATMQVKGQKTADERMLMVASSSGGKYATSQQSPVGSSRILQAMETVLSGL